jgi:hypothetical protein
MTPDASDPGEDGSPAELAPLEDALRAARPGPPAAFRAELARRVQIAAADVPARPPWLARALLGAAAGGGALLLIAAIAAVA